MCGWGIARVVNGQEELQLEWWCDGGKAELVKEVGVALLQVGQVLVPVSDILVGLLVVGGGHGWKWKLLKMCGGWLVEGLWLKGLRLVIILVQLLCQEDEPVLW